MSISEANVLTKMEFAPEIKNAIDSINLPEVQEVMKVLARYNLGVCIPHMHSTDTDFAALPGDTVQIEENCRVRWVKRSQLENMKGSVPVAWRWLEDGSQSAAECIQICSPSDDSEHSHRVSHLP